MRRRQPTPGASTGGLPPLTRGHGNAAKVPPWYRPNTLQPSTLMSSRVRVGIDLDGVCYDFVAGLRHYLTSRHGFDAATLVEADHWEFYRDWGLSTAQFLDYCHRGVDDGVLFRHGEPYPGTFEALVALYGAGFELHVLTDRSFGAPGRAKAATEAWLIDQTIPFHSLSITADKTSVWTDYMIEDKPENYLALDKAGTEVYLLSRPWNAWFDAERRVETLADFAACVMVDVAAHTRYRPPVTLASRVPPPVRP